MRVCGCAAICWALLTFCLARGLAPQRRLYCARADVAWRAYRAPAAFEARVQSLARDAATVQVKRVLHRHGNWPSENEVLRLKLHQLDPRECTGSFEVPLKNQRNFIVFAERRGHAGVALGPPLKKTKRLIRRIEAVYKHNYSRPAKVKSMNATVRGKRIRIECQASGRPPPRISWYKEGRPVAEIALRRFRVQNFRRRSVLVIRHAQRDDFGTYECRAQGAIGPPAVQRVNVSAPVASPPTLDTTTLGAPCPMPNKSSYCLNGGTCIYFKDIREQTCQCTEGFIGQRCEKKDVSNRSTYHSYTCKLGLSTSYYC